MFLTPLDSCDYYFLIFFLTELISTNATEGGESLECQRLRGREEMHGKDERTVQSSGEGHMLLLVTKLWKPPGC